MDEKNRIHSAVRNFIGKVIILCKRAHVDGDGQTDRAKLICTFL
jgi:hypothetical protein